MTTVTDLVAQRQTGVSSLTPTEFAAEADDPRTVVIDLREADERTSTGSIAGAIHVPRGLLEFRVDSSNRHHVSGLDPDARILLYCDDGARSVLAAVTLHGLGYHSVAVLGGGLDAWDAARLPLVGRSHPPY
ncbi:MAG TPA: rhodanese-like domain-containing protein [Ilumatobacter sp.]|nr:rhodanese-like domain-containing protein [Ilumatobacter sp.]